MKWYTRGESFVTLLKFSETSYVIQTSEIKQKVFSSNLEDANVLFTGYINMIQRRYNCLLRMSA